MLMAQPNGSVFAPMANLRVTCNCGAIYEVIETKGPSRESRPAKCVLCDREMFAWKGDNVGQLHLVQQVTLVQFPSNTRAKFVTRPLQE